MTLDELAGRVTDGEKSWSQLTPSRKKKALQEAPEREFRQDLSEEEVLRATPPYNIVKEWREDDHMRPFGRIFNGNCVIDKSMFVLNKDAAKLTMAKFWKAEERKPVITGETIAEKKKAIEDSWFTDERVAETIKENTEGEQRPISYVGYLAGLFPDSPVMVYTDGQKHIFLDGARVAFIRRYFPDAKMRMLPDMQISGEELKWTRTVPRPIIFIRRGRIVAGVMPMRYDTFDDLVKSPVEDHAGVESR